MAVAGDVFVDVFLCCLIFLRDVLDEIWDLIESVSEGFHTYFFSEVLGNNIKKISQNLTENDL